MDLEYRFAFETLSARERQIVTLYCDGHTQAAIGKAVGCNQKRINFILKRAGAKMKKCFEDKGVVNIPENPVYIYGSQTSADLEGE